VVIYNINSFAQAVTTLTGKFVDLGGRGASEAIPAMNPATGHVSMGTMAVVSSARTTVWLQGCCQDDRQCRDRAEIGVTCPFLGHEGR
jgi:hypothetical protein